MNGLVNLKGRRTGVHWGPGRARGGSQRELGMVPWTIRGGAQGKPGRRGDGNPPQESGAEGDRRKKEIKTNAGNRHH